MDENKLLKVASDTISKITNQGLLYSIVIIILGIVAMEHRFWIGGIGFIFGVLHLIGQIIKPKSPQGSSEFIQEKDRPKIKSDILVHLNNDWDKLDKLIPKLQDVTHKGSVDNIYKLDSDPNTYCGWLNFLCCDTISRLENKESIDLMLKWNSQKKMVNSQLQSTNRVEYINQNASLLKETLSDLIDYFEN